MKPSIFNTTIRLSDDRMVLYNAFSDKFIVAKSDISPLESNDFLEKKLYSIGALIDDNIDEIELYRNFIHEIDNYDESFHLIINPTLDCNFRCWYCYESHLHGSKMNDLLLVCTKKLILSRLSEKKIKSFSLSFFGGEPLLRFKEVVSPLIDLSAELCEQKKIKFDIHFTSNGYLINDQIVNKLTGKNCAFQITLDGARTSHDSTRFTTSGHGSYDAIIKNIIKLATNNIRVGVRINYTKANIVESKSIIDDFFSVPENQRKFITFDFQHVWQDKAQNGTEAVFDLVREAAEWFRLNGFASETHHVKHGGRHSCYGDNPNYLLINYNGDVFRCTARDFTKTKRHGVLDESGVVIWDENILTQYNTCKENQLVCLKCRVGPLCGGACRQMLMEFNNTDKCIYNLSEDDKDQMVMNHFENKFIHPNC